MAVASPFSSDAACRTRDQCIAMGVRQPAAAVEQRAVDVDGEEADGHRTGIDVYATTAIFHMPASRTSVN
jgi:hypothetical protein